MKNKKISIYLNTEKPDEQYILECLERYRQEQWTSYNLAIKRGLKSFFERTYGGRK